MIRMIASDLDGTLLGPDGQPSPRALRAIARFTQGGGVFVPATGRPLPHMPEWILKSAGIRYMLYANGARCVDKATGETVFFAGMSAGLAEAALALAKPYPGLWHLFEGGRTHPEIRDDPGAPSVLMDMVRAPGLEIEKLDLVPRDGEHRAPIWARIAALPGAVVSAAGANNVGVNALGGDKGTGIARLAALLGIKKSEIMALGDGLNDMSLLSCAGLAVAMGNAAPELRKIARFVAPANDEDGAAVCIERFALPAQE